MKILITPRSFASTSDKPNNLLTEKGYEIIRNNTGRPFTNKEMLNMISDICGIIIGIDDFNANIIDHAKKLKVISKYGVGLDNIDLESACKNNIVVTNTPHANSDAVADLAFALMLSLARRIPEADKKTKDGKWEKIIGNSVWEKTLGIIGLGKIGKQIVKRAKGFNMKILVYDINKDKEFAVNHDVNYVSKKYLLKESDFISLHVPLNEKTRGLIGEDEFKLMKRSGFLINTSRGGLIEEDSLYKALKEEKIKGAGLDAYINEPPESSQLKELKNIIMTSHNGAYTEEAIEKMGVQAARNLISVLEGKEPNNRIV